MSFGSEPRFLTREAVDAIHEDRIDRFGGLHGVRDKNAFRFIWLRFRLISTATREQALKLRLCYSKAAMLTRAGCRRSRRTI